RPIIFLNVSESCEGVSKTLNSAATNACLFGNHCEGHGRRCFPHHVKDLQSLGKALHEESRITPGHRLMQFGCGSGIAVSNLPPRKNNNVINIAVKPTRKISNSIWSGSDGTRYARWAGAGLGAQNSRASTH